METIRATNSAPTESLPGHQGDAIVDITADDDQVAPLGDVLHPPVQLAGSNVRFLRDADPSLVLAMR